MAGCAMIGQTIINVRAGNARTRLSTFSAGVFVIVLVVGLGGLVAVIPMAALVAVMVLVAVSTFDWHSVALPTLRRMPAGETVIMVVTVIATVVTHNLAIGVAVGVLTAMVLFAGDPPKVIIDMSRAHVWDASAVAALDAIAMHYARHDVEVQITGLNTQSHELHTTLTGQIAAAHA